MTEDVPLDITGHDDRDPPGSSEDGDESGDDAASDAEGDDGTVNGGPANGGAADDMAAEDAVASGSRPTPAGPGDDANPSPNGDSPPGTENGDGNADDVDDEDVEPVQMLVQLAEDGEIDPWDIDIVDVTDKFLARLDEADLRTSGRALFYASVLLRMKGDAMLADDPPEDDQPEPWERALAGEDPIEEPDPFASLEREMDRRLDRKRARGMPQTLDELVRDLREAERESWWKHSREYDTSESPAGYERGTQELDYHSADEFRGAAEPTAADVTATTHGEDIDALIETVYRAIRTHYEQGRSEVLFREIAEAGGSKVQTYLALLFLSHRGQVRLQQDELFGDLWIQDPSVVTGSGEVLAD